MKKVLITLLAASTLVACGQKAEKPKVEEKEVTVEEVKEEPKEVVKEEEIGDGTVYIENSSGTSEGGNIITILGDNISAMQIGLTSENMDGSKVSYIYVDGDLLDKQQLGDAQMTLELTKPQLTTGKHLVTIKQYENDDEKGNVTFLRNMEYEVKAK